MPIPTTSIITAEIQVAGNVASAGSSAKKFLFTFHYRRTSTAVTPTKAALDTIFQSTVVVPLGAALNIRYTQTHNNVRWVDDALDAPTLFPHAVAGGVAGDSMPMGLSAYLLFRTGIRGKSYRGGKHLGPMSEGDTTLLTEDTFNAAALTRLGAVATAALGNLTDSTGNVWVPCVLSRFLSTLTTNPTTVVKNDIVSILINKRPGWMRHRRVASVY